MCFAIIAKTQYKIVIEKISPIYSKEMVTSPKLFPKAVDGKIRATKQRAIEEK